MNRFDLGIIEGFYGKPWSWGERSGYVSFMKQHGYSYYIYAPKSDVYMRRKWRDPFPAALEEKLTKLSVQFRAAGIDFGVGFSPYEIYLSPFNLETKSHLQDRLNAFNRIGVNKLCILMDDMKGNVEDLAKKQIEILNWISVNSKAKEIIFCPTYYSDDPVLEKLYGKMPENYFNDLNKSLDSKISVFWTGDLVCSKGYTEEYLKTTSEKLGRKPMLWDNYPVNDGPRMCKFLHLAPFENRPASIAKYLTGHTVNPMNQAALSKIVMLTLVDSYEQGDKYNPEKSFKRAAQTVTNKDFAELLIRDLELFSVKGLEAITDGEKYDLKNDYTAFFGSHTNDTDKAAREIVEWLDGAFNITREEILAQ